MLNTKNSSIHRTLTLLLKIDDVVFNSFGVVAFFALYPRIIFGGINGLTSLVY